MMAEDIPRKRCGACLQDLSVSEFHKLRKSPDGFKPNCIRCTRKQYKEIRTIPLVTEKLCPRCSTTKPSSDYSLARATSDHLQKWCRECVRQHHKANPASGRVRSAGHYKSLSKDEKLFIALRQRLRKYGLTHSQYESMLASQGGLCAICDEPCKTGHNLAIDHCHKTGKVRQLLCVECNTMPGKAREREDLLLKAIEYLNKHKDVPRGELLQVGS